MCKQSYLHVETRRNTTQGASASLFEARLATSEYDQEPPPQHVTWTPLITRVAFFNKYANFDQLNGVTAFVALINNERLCLMAAVFMHKLFQLANNNAERARRIRFYRTSRDCLCG